MAFFIDVVSEELKKISTLNTNSKHEMQKLKEEKTQFEKELAEVREQHTALHKSKKEIEQEYQELEQESIHIKNEVYCQEELENICQNLTEMRPNWKDLKKMKEAWRKCRMYQKLLGFKWDFAKMKDDPQLVSGIVYNKNNLYLKVFSAHIKEFSMSDINAKMWNVIEKAAIYNSNE